MRVEDESTEDLYDIIRYAANKENDLKYLQQQVESLRLLAVQAENEIHRRTR